jgi:uncharacterized membrane protein
MPVESSPNAGGWSVSFERTLRIATVAAVALTLSLCLGVSRSAAADPCAKAGGTQCASSQYGYPYAGAPDCNETSGANCVVDAWNFYRGQCTS